MKKQLAWRGYLVRVGFGARMPWSVARKGAGGWRWWSEPGGSERDAAVKMGRRGLELVRGEAVSGWMDRRRQRGSWRGRRGAGEWGRVRAGEVLTAQVVAWGLVGGGRVSRGGGKENWGWGSHRTARATVRRRANADVCGRGAACAWSSLPATMGMDFELVPLLVCPCRKGTGWGDGGRQGSVSRRVAAWHG